MTSIFSRWVCSTANQCLLIKDDQVLLIQFVTFDPLVGSLNHTKKSHKESPRRFAATIDRFLMFSLCDAPCLAKGGWRICIYQGKALKTSGGLILKQPVWKTFRKWPQFGSVNPSSLTQTIDISGEVCFQVHFTNCHNVLSACQAEKRCRKKRPMDEEK